MFSKVPWSSSNEERPKDEGDSLATILRTPEELSDLNRLLVDCTETMRIALCDNFDPRKADKAAEIVTDTTDHDDAAKNPNLSIEDLEAIDNAKREKERIIKELSSPGIQELKKAALNHFDDWRDSVLLRVGEAINEQPKDHTQPAQDEAPPPKPPRPSQKLEAKQPASEKEFQNSNAMNVAIKEGTQVEDATTKLHELYTPAKTPLLQLAEAKRILILHSLLLLLLSLEHYSAQSRILLLHVISSLHLPIDLLTEDESKVARGLLEVAKTQMSADAETKEKIEKNALSRKWKVGLGAAAGATILAVTGGLAAPLLAAGLGTMMGGLGLGATAAAGYMGALAGSSVLIGGLFGAYGGRMTGKMVDKISRDVEDFRFIPIWEFAKPHSAEKDSRRLRVAIGISGWLTEPDEVVKPWKIIGRGIEGFALRWELEALMKLGNGLTTLIKSAAWGLAKKEIIRHTVFAALTAGLWPIMIVKASRVIDNPFNVAKLRSEKAGQVLAEALINKCQGERPVTLMGYSLGARVIYTCLQTLAERKAFGLVESVVLLGAPIPSDPVEWRKIRSVVSGRVVNVFSTNDYILGYLYRTSSLQSGISGLQRIKGVKNIENVDVSDLVDGHLKYRYLVGTILKRIGFEDIDEKEAEIEEQELAEEQKKEEAARKEAEAKHGEGDVDAEVEEMEQEVEKKNKESMMGWMSKKMSFMKTKNKPDESEEDVPEYEKLAQAEGEDPAKLQPGTQDSTSNEKGFLSKTGAYLGSLKPGSSTPAPSNKS